MDRPLLAPRACAASGSAVWLGEDAETALRLLNINDEGDPERESTLAGLRPSYRLFYATGRWRRSKRLHCAWAAPKCREARTAVTTRPPPSRPPSEPVAAARSRSRDHLCSRRRRNHLRPAAADRVHALVAPREGTAGCPAVGEARVPPKVDQTSTGINFPRPQTFRNPPASSSCRTSLRKASPEGDILRRVGVAAARAAKIDVADDAWVAQGFSDCLGGMPVWLQMNAKMRAAVWRGRRDRARPRRCRRPRCCTRRC